MAEEGALLPKATLPKEPLRPTRRVVAVLGGLVALGATAVFGYVTRARIGDERTVISRGPLGEEITVLEENACDKYPYLKYEVPSAVSYNNLANKGPDHGNGEGLVYKTIDLGRGAGDEMDREVLMTVNATSKAYQPFSPRLNGMQGKYGSINLNSGSKVDLLFNFFDRSTGKKLTMPEFAITWFDLDTGNNHRSTEFVTIGGFDSYHLTKGTEVKVEKQPDGRTKFSGSTMGTGEDNPKDPMFLTSQQKNRAVTLLYGPTDKLDVTIGASAGSGPRFFTFVGRPSLLCAVTVQQNFKPPLPDLTFSPPMEGATMTGEGEKFVSFAVKKGDEVKKGDVIATTQKDGEAPKQYRAPFDGKITQIQDQLKPGEKLDMRLSEKILAVIERPHLDPLPTDAPGTEGGTEAGGPGTDIPQGASFKEYLVEVGDDVSKGDPIATVVNDGGEEVEVQATGFGTVKQRQEEMAEGMLLDSVPDGNLISLGPYKALGPLDEDNVASAKVPEGEGYTFKEYHAKKGDIVKVGDPIATVVDKDGNEQVITATHGGVVSDLQELEEGAPVDRVQDGNLCTTGKFAPLPVEPGTAPVSLMGTSGTPAPLANPSGGAAPPMGEEPVAEQDPINPEGLKFVKYYVAPNDVVQTGDPIAQVEDEAGKKHDVLAPRPGVVKHIQDGLQEGMQLEHVMQDDTLATIDRLPALELSDDKKGSFAPPTENWQFKEWKVDVNDNVKKGEPLAILENPTTGEQKEVLASKSGTITEKLKELQPGDTVEEVTSDNDLATIGLYKEPDMSFREMGVQAPDMGCTFSDWKVEQDQRVHFGDPIAEVQCPGRRLMDGTGRRLQGPISIPSPGTGWISYKADLKPNQEISKQSVGPTIAKVNLGMPWWLTLLGFICGLCCCFGCLFKIMEKQPEYKPMPAQEPEKPPPRPEGLRLDFDDNGVRRTVYAKYRPLGIKHGSQAPIVAHDFTCNSYAKQELGVKKGWKLVRIGDKELHDSQDFDRVNDQLSTYMRTYPIWPLPLEFRREPDDIEPHVIKFVERPLGMEFSNSAPIKVDKVYAGSPAADKQVDVGWFLTRIGDFDVHENHNFREVLKYFKEGVQGLQDDGRKYGEKGEVRGH